MIKTKLEVVLNENEDESLQEFGWTDFCFDPMEVSGYNESWRHSDCTTVMFKCGERMVVAIPVGWFEKTFPIKETVVCARVKYEAE